MNLMTFSGFAVHGIFQRHEHHHYHVQLINTALVIYANGTVVQLDTNRRQVTFLFIIFRKLTHFCVNSFLCLHVKVTGLIVYRPEHVSKKEKWAHTQIVEQLLLFIRVPLICLVFIQTAIGFHVQLNISQKQVILDQGHSIKTKSLQKIHLIMI